MHTDVPPLLFAAVAANLYSRSFEPRNDVRQNVSLNGGVAPVRNYVDDLMADVLQGTLDQRFGIWISTNHHVSDDSNHLFSECEKEQHRVRTIDSQIMGKTRAGGQSAQRFARERERQKHEFFEKVADAAHSAFVRNTFVNGLLLGGTTITVSEFAREISRPDEGAKSGRAYRYFLGRADWSATDLAQDHADYAFDQLD